MEHSPPAAPAAFPFAGPADPALQAELDLLLAEHRQLEVEWNQRNLRIEELTANAVKVQSEAEVEEEKITNRLLKKLDDAKRNKSNVEERLRKETLEKSEITHQVAIVHANLVEIENQIETEQNCILHKLQRELIEVSTKKAQVQQTLYAERGEYLHVMRSALDNIIANVNGCAAAATTLVVNEDGSPVTSPTGPNPNPSSQAASVAALQHELNKLLGEHYGSEAALAEDGMVCGMLAQMLARVHQEVNIDRDRLAMMESELKRAQADVAIAERAGGGGSGGSGNGVGGGGGGVANNHHHHHQSQSVAAAAAARISSMGLEPINQQNLNALGGTMSVVSDDGDLSTCSSYAYPTPTSLRTGGGGGGGNPSASLDVSAAAQNASLSSPSAFSRVERDSTSLHHQLNQASFGTPQQQNQQHHMGTSIPPAAVSTSLFNHSAAAGNASYSAVMRSPSVSSTASCSSAAALRSHTHQVLANALAGGGGAAGGRGTPQ